MKEYIGRQDAIDVVARSYRYESDRMTALQELPTITVPADTERLKAMLMNALDIIITHESDDCSRYNDRSEFWNYLFTEIGTNLPELLSLGIDLSDYDNEIEHYFEEQEG